MGHRHSAVRGSMTAQSRRIFLSTSRSITSKSAWGIVATQLCDQGHSIVAFSGNESPLLDNLGAEYSVMASDVETAVESADTFSPEVLADYCRYRFSANFATNHQTVIQMMSRLDPVGSFRTLEREVFARKIYLEILSGLASSSPDFAIFDVTPHDAYAFAAMRILEWKGIPLLMFQPSLVGPQVMARKSLTETIDVTLRAQSAKRNRSVLTSVYDLSEGFINRLADGTGTPKMDSQRSKEEKVGTFSARLGALKQTVVKMTTSAGDVPFSMSGHGFVPLLLKRAVNLLSERTLRRNLRRAIDALPSVDEAPGYRFAFLALHYEPERSSIPEGYPFDSQLDAIIAVRELMPDNVMLIVKEHFSQKAAALRGFVGRSPEFYELLTHIPGVLVVGPSSNTRALMSDAECVFTFTGKVGIEAALLGTRVMFLGQPWWAGLPGASGLEDFESYDELLKRSIPSPIAVRRWLSEQIRSSLLPGLASVSPERYNARIARLPERFEEVEAEGILEAFRARVIVASGPQK